MSKASDNKQAPLTRRSFVKIAGLTAAPVLLGGLGGCRDTDTLTKIEYTDWADEVDSSKPAVYNNVPDAEPTTSLPKLYETKSKKDKQEEELPEYDDEDNTQEETEQTDYSPDTDSSDPNSTGTKEGDGDGNGDGGDNNDPGNSNNGSKTNKEADGISKGTKSASVGGDEVGNSEPNKDITTEPEASGSIIAFGEIANIVLLLGGTKSLWGCDATFLKKAKGLYSKEDFSKVHGDYWTSYVAGGKGISNKNFKKLCRKLSALKAKKKDLPVYLIYDAGIGSPVSKSQAKALGKYGIETTYFSLKQNKGLKGAMNYIQKIIDKDSAKKAYDSYWDFHDGLLAALSSANGGVAAYASASVDTRQRLSFKDGKKISSGDMMSDDDVRYTLVIDQWDSAVKYNSDAGSAKFGLKSKKGLGVCTIGWKWSPVSFYMQQAGVLNNAAAVWQNNGDYLDSKGATFYKSYAWAFSNYYAKPDGKKISRASIKDVSFYASGSGGKGAGVLMCPQSGDYGVGKLGKHKRFPTVVVTGKDAKKRMEYERDRKGVYAGHYVEKGATPNNPDGPACGIKGKHVDDSTSIWSCYIGWASAASDEYGADSDMGTVASSSYTETTKAYDVVLNPQGYYSNWVDGSVESVLEAAWAFEYLGNGAHGYAGDDEKSFSYEGCSSAKDVVEYFYKTFYKSKKASAYAKNIIDGKYVD